MALGNFLQSGTYSTVSTGMYDPQDAEKLISINLMVFANSDKDKILAHFSFIRCGLKGFDNEGNRTIEGRDYISDWDTYFAPTVMNKKDNNMQKMCYDYLKSLPYFSGVTDV